MTESRNPGRSAESYDAVIVGAGHNGLVAANLLADQGWEVLVLEASASPGGAVQSDELHPGFVTDRFSSFYPLTVASPVMASLGLERHGLRWSHAPTVLAHLKPDAPAAVLYRDLERTASVLATSGAKDAQEWRRLGEQWVRVGPPLLESLLSPFPPIRAGGRLAWTARNDFLDLLRLATSSVVGFAQRHFEGIDPALLLTGNALHTDVAPTSVPSAFLGWVLVQLGQNVGFPVPVGGAGRLAQALTSRLESLGGEVRVNSSVSSITVFDRRAVGVQSPDGFVTARHAVIAACDAEILYRCLLRESDIPVSYRKRMKWFRRANGTLKLDYALSSPIPWRDESASGAGTVHIGDSLAEMMATSVELESGRLPAKPFILLGQMTVADATRSPVGTESMWAYTHVPQQVKADAAGLIRHVGRLTDEGLERFAERVEDRIEAHAPGFRDRILARRVMGPNDLEEANPSLVGGDINGGTARLRQQLILRPVPGLGRAETPIRGLYLGSSSAHPGGAVHGACGANAARAALAHR